MKKYIGINTDLFHDVVLIIVNSILSTKFFGFLPEVPTWVFYLPLFLFGVLSYFLIRTSWKIFLEETEGDLLLEKFRSWLNGFLILIAIFIPFFTFCKWVNTL